MGADKLIIEAYRESIICVSSHYFLCVFDACVGNILCRFLRPHVSDMDTIFRKNLYIILIYVFMFLVSGIMHCYKFYILSLILLCCVTKITGFCPTSCKCVEPIKLLSKNRLTIKRTIDFVIDNDSSNYDESLEIHDETKLIDNNLENDDDIDISANCTALSLTGFPILLNPRTKTLILSRNSISILKSDELGVYVDLEYLDLSNNRILSIEQGALYTLQKLQVLNLAGNLMTSLTAETFSGLSELRSLDLSRNALTRLSTSIFR